MMPICNQEARASELVRHYAPQIAGKIILITGVSPGSLGESVVKQVAVAQPAMFILASRSTSKMQNFIDELGTAYPSIKVKPLYLSLLSFADVRKAAEKVNSWTDVPHIDVLVNNAGIMAVPYNLTKDGFESQFQTNHLSHFLFTNLLMGKILASKTPRIVVVSSGVHRVGHFRWPDPNFNRGEHYQRWLGYGQSKTANALMGVSLAEKLGYRGLLVFPICPGVSLTNLAAHGSADLAAFSADLTDMDNIHGNKISEQNGAFLSDCHVADPDKEEVYWWATSRVDAERLWKMSEKLVGQEFKY
ncbi:hypothetical protein BJX96DRAFT_188011 [Aspergillus floccosus]